jgi:hypothetical protein
MALTAPAVTGAILAAAPELKGVDWFRLATAVGSAVVIWAVIPANLALVGVTTGAAGSGVANGKVSMVPQPLPVPAAAVASGLLGFVSPSMTRSIGMGVAIAFSASAQYQGVSVGVGTGSDVSKIVLANPATLISTLQAVLNGSGLLGVNIPQLAVALGTGIPTLLLTGTGIGVVTGPAGPAPAVGTSTSRVF